MPSTHPSLPEPRPEVPTVPRPDTAAAQLLNQLSTWGLRHVFTVPGLQIDPLNKALAAQRGLQAVIANHELAAGYMADGYARASGRAGAVFAIGGPGCANLAGAAVAARADRSPVLFVTGNIPTAAQGRGEFQDGSAPGANDQGLARAALGVSLHCEDAQQLPHWLGLAARYLSRGEPVHLALAHDVQLQPAATVAPAALAAEPATHALPPPQWLAHGRTALFVDARAVALADLVREAAQRFGLPVMTSLDARGVVDECGPLAAGHLGFMPHPRAEALVGAGSALRASRVVQVGGDERWAQRLRQRGAPVESIGPEDFAAWYRNVPAGPDAATLAERRHWWQALAACQRPATGGGTAPAGLSHAQVLQALATARPADTAWVVDAGQVRRVAASRLRCARPGTLFMAEGMAPMGWSLGAAVGVALAQPQRPVVALLGDGAMRMHGIEIATAQRYRLPILFVLFDNQSYGSVLQRMATAEERDQAQLPAVQWAAFAQAFGVACHVARDEASLQQALRGVAGLQHGPSLLVVQVPAVDEDAYLEPTGIDWQLGANAD